MVNVPMKRKILKKSFSQEQYNIYNKYYECKVFKYYNEKENLSSLYYNSSSCLVVLL